uniref:G5 domain-containing protein n=1 Tax=uncultured Bacillota bacterium TaxID=344338 RepID=A0A650EMX7_9FIRM|nr:hypothetical protein Firmicute1046_0790 [uncultured Firmicutes bacterium]
MDTEMVTENSSKSKWRLTKSGKAFLCFAIVLAVILGTLSVYAAYVNAYDKIYPGVVVSEIALGGKTREEAGALLSERYSGAVAQNTLQVTCEGESVTLNLTELGAEIDVDSTVENAYQAGRAGGLLQKANAFLNGSFHKTEMDAVTLLDEAALIEQINALAAPFETPKTDYTYELKGNTLTVRKGSGGVEVDRRDAIARIKHEIDVLRFDSVALHPEPVEPEPLDVDSFYQELTADAVDAKYTRVNGEVVIDGGKPQVIIEKSKVKELVESGEESASVQVEVVQPNVTKEQLEAMMFRDTLGSFSTKYSASNAARSANVALAASRINEVILLPGETFSYDKTVKPRTKANGYKDAPVYVGNKVESGVGGGICQTSSTLYSAVLYSNLEIVSRTSHSLPVGYVPAGQDATIAEGYIDFVFRNNTDYPIKISAGAGNGTVSCSILGTKVKDFKVQIVNQNHSFTQPTVKREFDASLPKGTKKVTQKGAGGYSTSSTRIVTENGVEVKRETLTGSRYNSKDTIEVVNPEDKNTPSEQLSIYDPKANQVQAPAEPLETPNAVTTPEQSAPPTEPAAPPQEQDEIPTVDVAE